MKRLGIISAAVISVVMLATSAFAQDYQKGLEAYAAGDYAAAIQEWRPLAEQGDVKLGSSGSMMTLMASGTAVVIEE